MNDDSLYLRDIRDLPNLKAKNLEILLEIDHER